MIVVIALVIFFFVVYHFIGKGENKGDYVEKKDKSIKSSSTVLPSTDVFVLGCNSMFSNCPYYKMIFQNGDWNTKICYCKYINREISAGTKCQFAIDHPQQLTPGVFDKMGK